MSCTARAVAWAILWAFTLVSSSKAQCSATGSTAGTPVFGDVFESGDGLYHTYRIPAVLTTSDGSVLAFAEGRATASDHAQNDIVMRRSTDGGETWSPVRVLHDDGKNSLNNPCVLQVREGPHSGRVLLMYQRYPEGCHEQCVVPGYVGQVCRSFLMHSDDDGLQWSAPLEITMQVKRPTVATSIASGPGVGIQLRRGLHRGRLVMPFNQGPGPSWKVYAVYSDDGGDSWEWGELADDSSTPGTGNEVQMVELSDGTLLLNSRSNAGTKHRKIAHSFDGGESWTPLQDEPQLIEPQCMASILRYAPRFEPDGPAPLLYAGPNSTSARVRGAVHLSWDDGATWPVSRVLYPGAYAYSVLTNLGNGQVGVLFERDGYSHITLARLPLAWLLAGVDRDVLAAYCAGPEGAPPVAPSPDALGWTFVDPSGGAVNVTDVSPDGGTGHNAWQVDDSISSGGGRAHYAQLFTHSNIARAAERGWDLEVRMRLLTAPSISIFFEYASGQSSSDDRYLLFFSVSGNDVIATDLLNNQTYTCAGAMDGAYHTYKLRKRPGVAELNAEFFYDGASLGTLVRAASNGNAPAGGVHWGAGSSAGVGVANFHAVEFRVFDAPSTYCTAKPGVVCGPAHIAAEGFPEAGATSGFVVRAAPVRGARTGVVLYTDAGRANLPFQGGTLCVEPNGLSRAPVVASGGSAGQCDGVFSIDMNAFAAGLLGGSPQGFLSEPGTQVQTQWWGRDTVATGSVLSDALEFTVH